MANTNYTIKVWTSNPNNVADTANANDTLSVVRTPAVSGTFTINSSQATGGTNFQSFSAFASFINSRGVCGPVVVNVAPNSGPYLEKVYFGNISGTSASNTITINGNGNTINYVSPASADRVTVELDGTKYMILDSLTIRSDQGAQGFSILMRNQADWNIIRRCSIISSTSSTSTVYAGLALSNSNTSATSAGNNGNNNLIEHNVFIGGYYAISMVGGSSTQRATGNIIRRNTMRDFYLYAVYGLNQDNWQIFGNTMSRPTRTTISTFYGVYLGTSGSGVRIYNNEIFNAHGAAPYTNTFTAYPIWISTAAGTASNPNIIANNLIYDIQTNGIYYGIYLSGTTNHTHIYHNTVVLNTTSTSSSTTRLIWVSGTPTENVEIRNNLLYLSRPGTGERFLTYLTSNTAVIRTSNNAYFKDPAAGMTLPTFFRGTAFNTLADFQAAGADSNSVFANPMFMNINNNFRPTAASLNNIGRNLGNLVPFDFDSVIRAFIPDPGVYEFGPATCSGPFMITVDSIFPTGAKLSWQSLADTFQIHWGPVGYTPGSTVGTLVSNIFSKSHTLTGLPMNTCLHVYVRDVCGNSFSNWMGPVQVCTPIQTDAQLLQILGFSNSFCGNSNTQVRFVVRNNGFTAISSLPYSLQITGDLTQTVSGTYTNSIASGATDTVSVATLNTVNGGIVQIIGSVQLTGDQNTSNDTIQFGSVIIPLAPQALPAQACANASSAQLIAKPFPGVGYEWYNVPTGGTPISLNDTLTVTNFTATYYLKYQDFKDSLLATIAGGNSQSGNMFDVNIKGGPLNITGFTVSPNSTGSMTFEIYHRPGTHVGFENSATGWTLLQAFTVNVSVAGPNTKLMFTNPVTLQPGTHAFYVTRTTGSVNYTNGTAVGNILSSHPRIDIREGIGKAYPFGTTFSPRNFNGYIHFGSDACSDTRTPVNISIQNPPTAAFTYTISNYTVSFTGTFTDADSVYWTFGTAGSSSQQNPTFTFPQNGVYPVCVTAFNSCGTATKCDTLKFSIGINEIALLNRLKVYPNPNAGVFEVTFSDDVAELPVELLDLTGKVVYRATWKSAGGKFHERLELHTLPAGTYMLRIHSTAGQLTRKVVVKK
ncbi:MAG: T9SS type A sorting domain-containing protein [Thermaurantimonas sp.]|uniref:T9SS type A sorting domain-containing protein n=1 Tax=Thermaurantimonas sp. TaxID=2681568 RepID=UPI003918D6B0